MGCALLIVASVRWDMADTRRRLVGAAFVDAQILNENSYLGGTGLLDPAGENDRIALPDFIGYEGKAVRTLLPYGDGVYFTEYSISGPGFNIFGVSVGDSLDKAKNALIPFGYSEISPVSIPSATLGFSKGHVAILFYEDASGLVGEIFVCVQDPCAVLPTF